MRFEKTAVGFPLINPKAPLKHLLAELLLDGRIKLRISQNLVLTDHALKRLERQANPARL